MSKLKPGMTEREHHAWGALLKYVEAIATAYRYDRYTKSSKTGKKFDRLLRATRALRERLNFEYGFVASLHLISEDGRANAEYWKARKTATNSDVYFGPEVRALHEYVIEELEGSPPDWSLRMLGIPIEEYRTKQRARFRRVVDKAFLATRFQAQSLPWESTTAALPPPALAIPAPNADRHAGLRAALLENPDQPQADFVRLCHVHPNTVRRCRRELEEAGAIPYLAHRHAA
jgi:hypothetical protein